LLFFVQSLKFLRVYFPHPLYLLIKAKDLPDRVKSNTFPFQKDFLRLSQSLVIAHIFW